MKIVQYDEVEWKRGLQHRGGTFHYRHLLNGTPGALGNFQFNIGQLEGDFASPRHRHNFDQFRVQLEGTMNFDRNGKMAAGIVRLFSGRRGLWPAKLGRPLGHGGAAIRQRQRQRLSVARGSLCRHRRAEEIRHVRGRHLPPQRRRRGPPQHRRLPGDLGAHERPAHGISEAALSRSDHGRSGQITNGSPVDGMPGVSEKPLGTFTERQCGAALIKLARGATYRAGERSVYLVLSGSGHRP